MNVTEKPRLHQDWIDPHAVGIVRALQSRNHTTYLVGGCVRDLLLGIHPKDFDIATTARPEAVRQVIRQAYIIGRRFRLVLVRRDNLQFEVATFRRELRADESPESAPTGDNLFGTPEDDAQRRDFTINGLFYDPVADQLIDHAQGLPDLENRWVRMIGEPKKRLAEDPIRILRALRLKHMIGFSLDPALRHAMSETAATLTTTALPRRREELLKWLRLKQPDLAFREAFDLGLLRFISPTLHSALESDSAEDFYTQLAQIPLLWAHTLTPTELFGALVLSYVRAFVQSEIGSAARSKNPLENTDLQKWMRDELGMFNLEQSQVAKALQLESLLGRRHELERRGERRVRAVVLSEAYPLALQFAKHDHLLTGSDVLHWQNLRGQNQEEVAREDRPRRRRRPRRRNRTNRTPMDGQANARSEGEI